MRARFSKRSLLLLALSSVASAQQPGVARPVPEKLNYRIEWHLITAGVAHIDISSNGSGRKVDLHLESAGTISRLYRVLDAYHVETDAKFCPSSAVLDSQEGKRHTLNRLTFDLNRHKVAYSSQDVVKNLTTQKELEVAPCTREVMSALIGLRTLKLEPGKTGTIAITDGKKFVNARIEAQTRENVAVDGKQYSAVRYEAFLFDNVLYKRKGRLLIWISDDAEHLPVQMRFQMGFPIGNVLVELQK